MNPYYLSKAYITNNIVMVYMSAIYLYIDCVYGCSIHVY